MFGAKLCIFSQFLSPTIEPPVALVSAARTTPSYTSTSWLILSLYNNKFGNFHQKSEKKTYLEDDTADGGTRFHGLYWLGHGGALCESLVADAHVKVEASLGESRKVIQLHINVYD